MLGNDLLMLFTLGTVAESVAVFADFGVAFEFAIAVTVGGGISQDLILGAEDTVELFVIDKIFRPHDVVATHGALVGHERDFPVVDDAFADPRGFVGGIGHDIADMLIKSLDEPVIKGVKGNAVVNISGRHRHIQDKPLLVAGGVRLVSETFLVLPLVKQAAIRVGGGNRDGFLPGHRIIIMIVKRLFAVVPAVLVDLLHQLFLVALRGRRNRLFHRLLYVGVGFDVGAVHKYRFRGQIPRLLNLA